MALTGSIQPASNRAHASLGQASRLPGDPIAYGSARTAEGLIHGLSGRRVVFDWPAHALDRLLRSVAAPIVVARIDIPKCRLLAIPAPARPGCPAHRIPAGLVLPIIVSPAQGKTVLCPDDLRAHVEAGGLKGLLDLARMPARVPDECARARKQAP